MQHPVTRGLKWLETVEAQEDNILSFNQANTLINKYGDDLKGNLGRPRLRPQLRPTP
ncbi:hypothetical protein AGR4A_pAt30184 [Agrobacterium tumefaciens str. B6]|uniref:Uncharacterized protein n=1 Tax=Agrobacterium tumefaciens str. B6 TaxID=1183423 RepID=A0A822VD00_AGRTU|nr:hypothetical protein AGR4A_pAt30184 [Agrobacterium tumefaciens str. B6]SPZ33085.1 Uncharacterised protein [Agrobacterium tumefaciens]